MYNALTSAEHFPRPEDAEAPRHPGAGTALDFLRQLAAELSHGTVELPCFPDVIMRIHQALMDPRTTPERAVQIVGTEPHLVARLMQTANSATFNVAGNPVHDLRTAMTRLGQQLVQSVAMTCAVQQMKAAPALQPIAEQLTALWRACIAVASLSQVIARRTKVNADEAFLTGLMHGIGRLYIMVRAVEHTGEMREEDLLDQVADWHPSIGKVILENWGFSDRLSAAVGAQAEYQRPLRGEADLTDVLIASIWLARCLSMPLPRTIDLEGVSSFSRIGLSPLESDAILSHAEHQLAALYEALGF
jgi:HD-like signal output (HDOD) protein